MKTRYIKGILTLLMAWVVLPMMGQDCMEVHFKDGTERKFYLRNVKEITSSRIDASGVQQSGYDYQHVTTNNKKYVYSLADIDSITFSKYSEEQASQNLASASTAVFPILANCESIGDVEGKIDQIASAQGVEKAWIEDCVLYVKVAQGRTISFDFGYDEQAASASSSMLATHVKEAIPKASSSAAASGEKLKAVVVNQTHFDETSSFRDARKDFFDLKDMLGQYNIDTTYVAKPDLDFYAVDMFNYDIIALFAHGFYKNKKHGLATGIELGKIDANIFQADAPKSFTAECDRKLTEVLNQEGITRSDNTDQDIFFGCVKEKRDGDTYWVAYIKILESIYDHLSEDIKFTNPQSILFTSSCNTLRNSNSFADKFFSRGLGTFLGYDFSVSAYTGPPAAKEFFKLLLQGKTVGKAYSDMPGYYLNDPYFLGYSCLKKLTNPANEEDYYNSTFITKTLTMDINPEKAANEFTANNYVEVEGYTTSLDPTKIVMGFVYSQNANLSQYEVVGNIEKTMLNLTLDNGNVLFKGKITGIEPGKTYYYRAYTTDGLYVNYGDTKSFKIEQPTNDRVLMLSKEVNGATYKIYKQVLDENNVHVNPDGWKCYKSALTLDITKNNSTQTYTIDDNIYLDKQESHHGGQRPCLLLDYNANQLFVFINSKDANSNNYTMDGNAYRSSLTNISFTLEKVFTDANWGWSPYFTEASNGQLKLRHFSYAGYYAMYSTRSSNGSWSNVRGEKIYPDDFEAQSLEAGNVLVVGGSSSQANTSCPDGNHPHMIDLGLPSGTKWACCNVGADKPEADGHYYSWGEIQTKNTYNWNTYEYGYYNFDEDWSHLVNIGSNIGGTRYDAATVQWGESWRMPTIKQYVELIENTNPTWTTQNDRKGFLFTRSNGGTLFFPASGYYGDNEVHQYEYYGNYWTSVLYDEVPAYAYELHFQPNKIEKDYINVRYSGLPIRPVAAK